MKVLPSQGSVLSCSSAPREDWRSQNLSARHGYRRIDLLTCPLQTSDQHHCRINNCLTCRHSGSYLATKVARHRDGVELCASWSQSNFMRSVVRASLPPGTGIWVNYLAIHPAIIHESPGGLDQYQVQGPDPRETAAPLVSLADTPGQPRRQHN
jgi:hypothetical protein